MVAKLKIVHALNYGDLCKKISNEIKFVCDFSLYKNRNSSIGWGYSPDTEAMFDYISAKAQKGEIDFSKIDVFLTEDFYQSGLMNPHSIYKYFNDKFVLNNVINASNLHSPDKYSLTTTKNTYDFEIKNNGGLDLVILNLGPNGELNCLNTIDINKPRTMSSLVPLNAFDPNKFSRFTKAANNADVSNLVSVGGGIIYTASKIIVIAQGQKCGNVVSKLSYAAKNGLSYLPPFNMFNRSPLFVLLNHNNTTIICDDSVWSYI